MNDTQIWMLIGVVLAILVLMVARVLVLIRAEFVSLREDIHGLMADKEES